MEMERRAWVIQLSRKVNLKIYITRNLEIGAKPISIWKRLAYESYHAVAINKGAAGIDNQTLLDFEKDLKNNLYKIWNRLSSGSYFPPAVKEVLIPKRTGGERPLGIPTISDRIAQTVIKKLIEADIDKLFSEDSYGYRQGKSAHDALKQCRKRCWQKAWVIDLDIKGFFDNIDHDLLMLAVDRVVEEKWIKRYIQRWLKANVYR